MVPETENQRRLADFERGLSAVRSTARRLLTARALAWLLAAVACAAFVIGTLDYFLRTPTAFRVVLWVLGVGGVAWLVRRWVWPALGFRPSLTEIALRVERTPQAERAGLRGTLAAALDLARSDEPAKGSDEAILRAGVIESARTRLAGFRLAPAVLAGSSARKGVLLALAATVPIGLTVALAPRLARVGARRVLTPWAAVDWPKRTAVSDATGLRAHPIGAAVPLRAVLSETDRRPGRTDVWANYRLVRDPDPKSGRGIKDEPYKRVLLTGQSRTISAPATVRGTTGTISGESYERLLDPAGLVGLTSGGSIAERAGGAESAAARSMLEYWFETEDDATEPARIALVEPPGVVSASARITPPSYVGGPSAERSQGTRGVAEVSAGFAAGTRELGPGRDERASVAPVISGSKIVLELTLNKPLPAPASATEMFGADTTPSDATVRADAKVWRLSWTAAQSVRLPVVLSDEHGIKSVSESAYQFTVVADQPASATVLDPSQDEAVIATAALEVVGEGRDDTGLAWASVEYETASPPAGSAGAPAEGAGVRNVLAKLELGGPDAAGPRSVSNLISKVAARFDLAPLALRPRDEVWVTALAQDNFAIEGNVHEPTRSAVRRLRIIAESELVEQIRGEMNGVRQAAIRLDQEQAEAMKRVGDGAAAGDTRALQEGITQRIVPQADTVRRLSARVDRNGLSDRALGGLLEDAGQSLEQAAERSAEAAESLAKQERSADEPGRSEAEALAKTQRGVRDQLGQLISMLDRGQDGWVARRELQRLLDEQNRLIAQTGAIGKQTAGKPASELTPQQRAQLEQIAQDQQDQSSRSSAALQDLAERGRQLAKLDPALAQAMKEAAKKGEESRLSDAQRDAAEQVKQNQTSSAGQNQRQAAQSLEEMLQELDDTEKNRDLALRRQLEEIIEALDALVTQQNGELRALGEAATRTSLAGLDKGMISLHGATLAVAERVRSGFRELVEVADLLDGATDAQSTSITLLRAASPQGAEVDQAERISLDRLKNARELAEKIQSEAEKRDQERKRAELRKAYREALELQVGLHGDTAPLIGLVLDRKQRAGARGLGERQLRIKTDLHKVLGEAEGLSDFKVFDFAHRRLDQAAGRAAEALREGNAPRTVGTDQKTAIRILQALVEALKEGQNKEFKESPNSNSGEGQSGGEQPIIPPIAELKLLRLMQQEAADLTRAVGDAKGHEPLPATIEEVAELQAELFKRAEELIEKQQSGPGGGGQPPDEAGAEETGAAPPGYGFSGVPRTSAVRFVPSRSLGLGVGEPPADNAPAKDEASEGVPPADDPLPSLDELLGLPAGEKAAGDAEGSKDPGREELDRKLAPAEAAAEFERTVEMMKQAASRLGESRDAGVGTQRLQDGIVKRLDQLISAAERNQQQSPSKSKSKQQQQKPQSQQQRQQSQNNKGDNRAQVDPPARQDGSLSPPKPAASAAWGNLPEHVRESLMQGLGDRFSSLYQSMTEAYYKRLAEEPKPGAAR